MKIPLDVHTKKTHINKTVDVSGVNRPVLEVEVPYDVGNVARALFVSRHQRWRHYALELAVQLLQQLRVALQTCIGGVEKLRHEKPNISYIKPVF